MSWFARWQQHRDLKIALEPLNRFESDLVNTAEDVLRMVNDINHPAACVMLDRFHMNIEERDMEKAIVSAGDKLIHLQVSENYRGTPGTGQTRWDAYKKGLEAINYNGTVTIESFTPDNKELAGAVCFWTPMAESQDGFAIEGLSFLKKWASEKNNTTPTNLKIFYKWEKKINVAIVGLGFGAEFIPIYQLHPDANMYAICQRNTEKLNQIGDEFDIEQRYADYDELLKDKNIDAVHINTPIQNHAEQSIKALRPVSMWPAQCRWPLRLRNAGKS